MTYEAPGLDFEMIYTVRTTHPLEPTVGSPFGAKQFWQVSEATLDGARVKAHLAGAGLDWMSGRFRWLLAARRARSVPPRRRRGHPHALHRAGSADRALCRRGRRGSTHRLGRPVREARVRFETGAQQFLWLNTNMFIAKGRLLGTGHIEYEVYRVL